MEIAPQPIASSPEFHQFVAQFLAIVESAFKEADANRANDNLYEVCDKLPVLYSLAVGVYRLRELDASYIRDDAENHAADREFHDALYKIDADYQRRVKELKEVILASPYKEQFEKRVKTTFLESQPA